MNHSPPQTYQNLVDAHIQNFPLEKACRPYLYLFKFIYIYIFIDTGSTVADPLVLKSRNKNLLLFLISDLLSSSSCFLLTLLQS